MKYIKHFENVEYTKYKVGDYVLLDLYKVNTEWEITDDKGNFTIPALVLIIDEPNIDYYEVEFYDGGFLDIREEHIKRLLTPEEIEEYKIKKDGTKYNL